MIITFKARKFIFEKLSYKCVSNEEKDMCTRYWFHLLWHSKSWKLCLYPLLCDWLKRNKIMCRHKWRCYLLNNTNDIKCLVKLNMSTKVWRECYHSNKKNGISTCVFACIAMRNFWKDLVIHSSSLLCILPYEHGNWMPKVWGRLG